MLATLLFIAGIAQAAAPAPLPDRWLLKLVPENLPPLPDRLYSVQWYYTSGPFPRFGPSWEFWAEFHKPTQDRPAEAALTRTGADQHGLVDAFMLERLPTARGHRTVPLADHGSLVEFDRKLYTATLRGRKLHLGSAIEVMERVWYQAGTASPSSGNRGVTVEEWLIDFRDDPRTADRGKATLRGQWRVLTEPEGDSFHAEVTFHAGKTYTGGRTVTLNWPHGMQQTRLLPRLEIEDAQGGANDMRIDGMHRLSLSPAMKPRPEIKPETVELVQPPGKKAGK